MGNALKKSSSKHTPYRSMSSTTARSKPQSGDPPSSAVSFEQRPRVHKESSVLCVAPGRQKLLVSGGNDSILLLTDISNGLISNKWVGHEKDLTKVVYSPSADLYFSASRDKTVNAWHCGFQTPVLRFVGHDLVITGIAVNSDNSLLCSGSRDNTIRLWDVSTGKCLKTNCLAQNVITHVTWVHHLNVIAQSGEDKEFRLWDPRTMNVAVAFPRKQYIQTYCDVSEDNNYCITSSNGFGGNGCEVTLWDVRKNRLMHEFKGHYETVCCCRFIPTSVTGKRSIIATSSNDCSFRLWDRDTKECFTVQTVVGSGPLTSIAPFEDGNICVSSFSAGIQLFNLVRSSSNIPNLLRTAAF